MSAKRRRQRNQQGTVAVITAAGLLLILGIAGLALDLGHLYVVKSELQRAADAGAMAGVRSLYPYPLSSVTMPLTPKCAEALDLGRGICQANLVDGGAATIANIQTGSWNWSAGSFAQGCSSSPFSNALTITVRRDDIPLTVMGGLGLKPVNLQATSIAVMDWVSQLEQGVSFVFAIGKNYAQGGDVYIYLNPDPLDGGGWYAKDPQKPNASLISGYLSDPTEIPAIKQGDTVNLDNGVMSACLKVLGVTWIGKTVWVRWWKLRNSINRRQSSVSLPLP